MRFYVLVCLTSLVAFTGCFDDEGPVLYDLRCENLVNPLGIDNTTPRFSWKIRSNKNGTEQTAFQVRMASDLSGLDKGNADLWNSGKIKSSSSVLVPYQGKPLKQGSLVYWKVRVWDESGKPSPWSPVSEFSVGLLDEEHWHDASYIGFASGNRVLDCPQLKQSFNMNRTMNRTRERMFLYVNSLGYHEVYINGKKVGDGVLTPAVSQFDKRSLVNTYDISSLVKKGQNDVVIWLGSGWYSGRWMPEAYNDGPLVKAQLEYLAGNQREVILVTDSTWKGRRSGYTSIGRTIYGGEQLNGKIASNDLFFEDLDDRNWSPVRVVTIPQHEVTPQMVELNRIMDTAKPVAIWKNTENTFLIDMGKSITGWVEIHFPDLQKSQEIKIEYSSYLDTSGQLVNHQQVDRYLASGEGEEVFKNKFNYRGFRYIQLSNLNKAPGLDSVKAHLIHTDYELASSFICSDSELNKIHDMVFYTLRNVSLGGYIVDCPYYSERQGYGGDGNASNITALTMFNLAPLYTHWLQIWADCQRDDGGMPHTAPYVFRRGGGIYWCGFIIPASWGAYMNYGDSDILEKHYPVMRKWLKYVEEYATGGLISPGPKVDYRGMYLGDWASPVGIDQRAKASVNLVVNCFISVCYDHMQRIASVLQKTNDAETYMQKRDNLNKLIHQTFFDNINNSYATGTQIDLTYPFLAGVVPADLAHSVKRSLIKIIEENNGHFATGLVGIQVFTEWAIKNQETDLMYSMLKKKGYPGYLYMIENGATTTWEHWEGNRSRIHNCYNGIGSWFYQAVGGIRPLDPGYKRVLIQPQIPDGIEWAKTSKETSYGTLKFNWEIERKAIKMELEIPVGIEIEMPLPAKAQEYQLNGKKFEIYGDESPLIKIKSGKYDISYSPFE